MIDKGRTGILVNGSELGIRTLQIPQATVHSSLVDEPWLAWHSMPVVVIMLVLMLLHRRRWFLQCCRRTQVHDVVSANGAVINDDIPSPEGNGIPLDKSLR